MKQRTKVLLGLASSLVLVVVVAAGLTWYFVLRDDPPAKASLAGAIAAINTATPASATSAATTAPGATTAAAATSTAVTNSSTSNGDLSGAWVPDTTQQSFLGYRVVEQLARIGANTAVGRTSAITGQVVIANNSVTSATITADLTKLASDNNQRDGQLKNQAIETNKFPKATFVLSDPVSLPSSLAEGTATDVTLAGKLTLHGVTKDVSIPAQAQLTNGLLVVVGSIDIAFSDYSISKPNGASVLSIEDHGTMELQLFLKKS